MRCEVNRASRPQGPTGLLHLQLPDFLTLQVEGDPEMSLRLPHIRKGLKQPLGPLLVDVGPNGPG